MSSKRIKSWDAESIAGRMADAAFCQLFKPYDERYQDYSRAAYDHFLNQIGLLEQELIELNLCNERSVCQIDVCSGADGEESILVRYEPKSKKVASSAGFSNIRITSHYVHAGLTRLEEEFASLKQKRAALRAELSRQLEGKTVTAAKKAWPEAAPFINAQLNIKETEEMTTPLDVLLGRFLPLLAAPKETSDERV